MKKNRLSPFLFIIPLFILVWGFFNLYFFDPFYAHAPDPEYPYLINGLNVALLEFSRIGHFDHPGTPFQVYCGLVIRITHFFAGKESIIQDVFNRPEYYLSAISFSLFFLQALLCFFIAWIGKKREITIWKLIVLQSGVLLCITMLSVFGRVIPERWIVVVSFLFIINYLLYGYKDKAPLKFAIWSGVIMGMGMATKFNFLPIILIPFFVINSNKNRIIYAFSGVASFVFFLLPIIKKFGYYRDFIVGIATHDGIYGGGEKRMFNPESVKTGISQIFSVSPTLALLIFTIVIALFLAFFYRKKHETNPQILFFAGILIIIFMQIIMVAKHFKFYYMLPLITMYPFVLFILDGFFQKIGSCKKWSLLPVILLFTIFSCLTIKQTYKDYQSEKNNKIQRDIERKFVTDNLSENNFWFVDPTWQIAPYVENGLVYGISYVCWPIYYSSELIKKNPNVITYENSEEFAQIWRGHKISVDSLVVTRTPIHIYSTFGRRTETIMDILWKAAQRNTIHLSVDTLFSSSSLGSHIMVMQNKDSQKDWNTEEYILSK